MRMRSGLKLVLMLALACLAALGLALGVGACGEGTDSGGDSTAGNPSQLSGTITVWDMIMGFPGYAPVAEEVDADFERLHPGVTVKHVNQPFATFEAAYRAAFAAHQGPDALTLLPGAGVLSYRHGLEVLDDRITPEFRDELTGWSSASSDFTDSGEIYGVPMWSAGSIFYYNKDLFEKAGLPREFQPESWDELREAGEKLKAAGIQPFTGGNKEGWENAWWYEMGLASSATAEQTAEIGRNEIPATDQIVTEALEPELMMQEADLFPSDFYSTPQEPDGANRLGEGKGAIHLGWRTLVGHYAVYVKALGEETVGMFRPPAAKYYPSGADYVWAMPKFAKNKEAVWAYLEYVASPEGMQPFLDASVDDRIYELSNNKNVALPADAPKQARQLLEWANAPDAAPGALAISSGTQVFGPIDPGMNEVLQGRSSLEDVQQEMQEIVEKGAG